MEQFVDGFLFRSENRLKFSPDDKVNDIYKALYPSSNWGDALELETFAINLKEHYSFNLEKVWNENITLGQIFKLCLDIEQ